MKKMTDRDKPIGKMTNKIAKPGNAYFVAKYRLPDIDLKKADEVSKALYDRVVKFAANDLIEIEPKMAEGLLNSPYMQKIYKGRGMRVFEMPQEIADYMNKTSELFTIGNKQAEQVLKAAVHLQNLWKPLATIARPFWHVRNVTYNQMQLFLSGVSPWDLIPKAAQATKIQRGKKGLLHTAKFGDIKLSYLKRHSKKLGLYGVGFAGGDITTEPLLSSKMAKALRGGKLTYKDIHVKTLAQRPAEFMEDNAHLVAWLDYISKSKDADIGTAMLKGAEHAFKYVFDYGDISVFERSYMKLVDPFYCVDDKTEALTKDGWKKHNEIKVGDDILTLNMESGKSEWKTVDKLFEDDYSGNMYSFEQMGLSALVTPDHKWAIKHNGNDKLELKSTEELNTNDIIPLCVDCQNLNKNNIYSDDFIRLVGWIVTEGHYRKNHGKAIEISQSRTANPKYVLEIKNTLNRLGYNYHEFNGGIDKKIHYFGITGENAKMIKEMFPEKILTNEFILSLTKYQIDLLIEILCKGDGSYSYNNIVLQTNNKKLADGMQFLLSLGGYPSYLRKRINHGNYSNNSITYNLTIKLIKNAKVVNTNISEINYNGIIWCPHTKNETWFARRNGKVYFTGNTWHRKAVGLYASELLQHPDKFSKLGKAKRTLGKATPETEQEKALKPDWMKEAGYIKSPFKSKEGKPLYIDIAMPPDDLQMLFGLKDIYGVLTPYKTIFELIHKVTGFPELGTLEEGDTPAPAWMVSLPEKTWKLLKLRPGRQIDYSTGEVDTVLMIPKAYLRAIETALPTMRDVHNMYPQPIKLSLEKATTKTWSQGTGIGIITENITGWRNAIYYEIQELQKEITKEAKKYEGIEFKGKKYNYTESKEYLEKMQRIRELSDKLRY